MDSDDRLEAAKVVAFWRDAGPRRWFAKDDAFDRELSERFMEQHLAAARREFDGWMDDAVGALALLILLDQFPRNAFRGTAHMFATDPLALRVARRMVELGLDRQIDEGLRPFCYLPFEHSEDAADQQRSMELLGPLGEEYLRYARVHQEVIRRFGRFPHRNAALGRVTTAEEQAFLEGGGFAG